MDLALTRPVSDRIAALLDAALNSPRVPRPERTSIPAQGGNVSTPRTTDVQSFRSAYRQLRRRAPCAPEHFDALTRAQLDTNPSPSPADWIEAAQRVLGQLLSIR